MELEAWLERVQKNAEPWLQRGLATWNDQGNPPGELEVLYSRWAERQRLESTDLAQELELEFEQASELCWRTDRLADFEEAVLSRRSDPLAAGKALDELSQHFSQIRERYLATPVSDKQVHPATQALHAGLLRGFEAWLEALALAAEGSAGRALKQAEVGCRWLYAVAAVSDRMTSRWDSLGLDVREE